MVIMETKCVQTVVKRPKWSKKEVKKRSKNLWDHDAAGSNPVTPTENSRNAANLPAFRLFYVRQ